MRRGRRSLGAAALGLALAVAAHAAEPAPAPATIEALMEGMARAKGVLAEWSEVKELALLSAPIESRGVLHFIPPDRMVRRTLAPAVSSLVVDGKRVLFRDTSGAAPVDLSGDPSAKEFVDNFTTIFRGDLGALRAKYEVTFESTPPRWQLGLVPRDAVLRRFVASVTLAGEGETMREMVLQERDGDRTTTRFGKVETDHVYTPVEVEALFGAAPPGAP
ncbi:MAG TPA: outer membrane lipoprotein carrier protein LolA [Myxococcota bacterium]|nr:outer membrane lipoprotein carrier protein LolA [Myxococcota bacterium]